jgi:hypothetical protein
MVGKMYGRIDRERQGQLRLDQQVITRRRDINRTGSNRFFVFGLFDAQNGVGGQQLSQAAGMRWQMDDDHDWTG